MTVKPNIYIGLVCAAGTDLTDVKQQLKAQLAIVNYKYEEIKVSSLITEALELPTFDDEYQRMSELMAAGDTLRKHSQEGSGVASLIVTGIRSARNAINNSNDLEQDNSIAFVIDSLKNPKEIEVLDQLYGRNFYSIGVYSSPEDRKKFLANRIARSKQQAVFKDHFDLADELIAKDEKGKDETGQSVRDTFPKSDFFTEANRDQESIRRFVRLIFRDPFITPTLDEYLMFVAKATALRSCDLSRQVGAVISDKEGTIVATGCNEVPFPHGGFYFEGKKSSVGDNRDKEEKHDPNFNEMKRSISEFLDVLKDIGYITQGEESDKLANELLHGTYREELKDARIRNLIEFSRVVHAEMHAISQAAIVGRSTAGTILHCTTYPCHLCARHIIASGIGEVVYIEPYPKSLTQSLYQREIISEPDEGQRADCDKVIFRSFRGISPTLYQRVFTSPKRKDAFGAIATWLPDEAMPVGAASNVARPEFELIIANRIAEVLDLIHKTSTAE